MGFKYGHKATSLNGVFTFLKKHYSHIPSVDKWGTREFDSSDAKVIRDIMVNSLKKGKGKFMGRNKQLLPDHILAMNIQNDWSNFKAYLAKNHAPNN